MFLSLFPSPSSVTSPLPFLCLQLCFPFSPCSYFLLALTLVLLLPAPANPYLLIIFAPYFPFSSPHDGPSFVYAYPSRRSLKCLSSLSSLVPLPSCPPPSPFFLPSLPSSQSRPFHRARLVCLFFPTTILLLQDTNNKLFATNHCPQPHL